MQEVVVVGVGELGSVFALGFLKCGRAVFPVTRGTRMAEVARVVPDPALALVAVGEADLDDVLAQRPLTWPLGLLQNELRPAVWLAHGIENPTVAVVWFEKKPASSIRELLPTVLHGPEANLLADALAAVGVTTRIATSPGELTLELAKKNLYIGVTNIAGLVTGGTVGALWSEHHALALAVARDVLALERRLCEVDLDEAAMLSALEAAIAADPAHACAGRSAPVRLSRALGHAERLGVPVPELGRIAGGRA